MADALLVVDMLRGFLEKGHPLYCGDGARRIIPKVRRLLQREAERGSCIFYICDEHRPDDLEFKMFPPPLRERQRRGRAYPRASRLSRRGDEEKALQWLLRNPAGGEAEESVIVAQAMKGRLEGVRLDTPAERGRVTPDLVKEVRARLDLAGFPEVKIVVSGGVDPERIRSFGESGAPVDIFGVGSYISRARPIDFTADLHEVGGKPLAKRGGSPGSLPIPG